MKSKIIRITESDLQNMIKEGVCRVLKEAYSSGNDGNGIVGGRYWSSQVAGETTFPFENYADYLFEAGLIDKGQETEGEEYKAITNYLNAHKEDFVIEAICDSGDDEYTNKSWCSIEPNPTCLKTANKCIEECPCMSDEVKKKCIDWNNLFFNEDAMDYDNYTWDDGN